MKKIGNTIQRLALLLSLLLIMVVSSGCTVEGAVPILNPPRALRLLTNVDTTPAGSNLPAPPFTLDAGNRALLQAFWADTKFIDGLEVGTPNYIAIEFYAYNVETGFNGYNIYAMGLCPAYTDEAMAWLDFKANLTLYQSAHSGTAPTDPLYPVIPGTISSPYYASIASNTISFSGGLTKIVAVFYRSRNYGSANIPSNFTGGNTYYIGVTAVSITEGSIYESLPSNIIKITL